MYVDEPGMREPRRHWRSRRMLGPSLIMLASLALAMALYFGYLGSSWVQPVAQWTARWTGLGLGLFGIATRVDGTVLASDSFAVNIVAECTAIGPLALFVGAVMAYPSPLKAKALGVLPGLAAITFVNLIRIISLFWIGSNLPQYLDAAHLLVWQTAIILFAIVLWLFWVDRLGNLHARQTASPGHG